MSNLEDIRRAAEQLDRDIEITLLTSHDDAPTGISRVGGPGVELGARRPQGDDGQAMTHIWTLATADVPALAAAFPEAAAVALYMLDPQSNEAWEAHNGLTALVPLSTADLAGRAAAPTEHDLTPRRVDAVQVDVASAAFEEEDEEDDSGPSPQALRDAIYGAAARAGGRPLWLQGDEHDGEFLLQFDETFANINLGDSGIMYVFTDTQFWQCH